MLDVVTMGEMLVQFNFVTTGPLRHSAHLEKHAAGAEANFAVGMARMVFTDGLYSGTMISMKALFVVYAL